MNHQFMVRLQADALNAVCLPPHSHWCGILLNVMAQCLMRLWHGFRREEQSRSRNESTNGRLVQKRQVQGRFRSGLWPGSRALQRIDSLGTRGRRQLRSRSRSWVDRRRRSSTTHAEADRDHAPSDPEPTRSTLPPPMIRFSSWYWIPMMRN